MKLYALSLAAGLLVGIVYSLLQVRSPAPPLIALIGLLGILMGEQLIPLGKQWLHPAPASAATVPAATQAISASAAKPTPSTSPAQVSHAKQ